MTSETARQTTQQATQQATQQTNRQSGRKRRNAPADATPQGPAVTVVIPTIGRPSLAATLAAIGPREAAGPQEGDGPEVIVVDDRPGEDAEALPVPAGVRVLRSGGRGPAAARNVGWRAATTPWVAFLDDDVVPGPGWARALAADLARLPAHVGGSQGRLEVPLPGSAEGRRPTDAERNTAGLAGADWITADMAYRRTALEATGGFDERFPGAYREDADLAIRVERAGFCLVKGERLTRHPVRGDGFWSSVRFQRGNASDAIMRQAYGRDWRLFIGGPGRLRRHALTTGAGLLALTLAAAGVRTGRRTRLAAGAAGLAWLGLTGEFAWARIAPGPRTPGEIWRMAVTSVVIPPVACAHRLRGELAVRTGRRP
ncbi:glycosyltransferase family 2 protein [Microbispora sp. H10885]|uniref:glycosyltransferase family 2 protein n=1 Tax=Microbispora sp. H10885 TaxID=2729110 RepID=UPI00160284EF|nr:glycosyltransferase [Microbispora sp. H10885]